LGAQFFRRRSSKRREKNRKKECQKAQREFSLGFLLLNHMSARTPIDEGDEAIEIREIKWAGQVE